MPILTANYAALLAFLFIFLSVRVIAARRSAQVAIGDGDVPELARRMRVHANFAEYVPLALILAGFLELQTANPVLIHFVCAILLIGRLFHAYGVSNMKEVLKFRVIGMLMTFSSILVSAAAVLFYTVLQQLI